MNDGFQTLAGADPVKFGAKKWLLLIVAAIGILFALSRRGPEEVAAYPAERVLRATTVDGVPYVLADDGNVFRVITERGTWTWVDRIFDCVSCRLFGC